MVAEYSEENFMSEDKEVVFHLSEKSSYDYIYLDSDNNIHLLCPIIGGDTIGIDNTCESTKEFQDFFGLAFQGADFDDNHLFSIVEGKSKSKKVLKRYRDDLQNDIALLEELTKVPFIEKEIKEKQKRLRQIENYLKTLNSLPNEAKFKGWIKYPSKTLDILNKKTNCLSILLSPSTWDNVLSGSSYVFSLERGDNAIFRNKLREFFDKKGSIDSNKAIVLNGVINKYGDGERDVGDEFIQELIKFLEQRIKSRWDISGINLKKSFVSSEDINSSYLVNICRMVNQKDSPTNIADAILMAALSEEFWKGLSSSHFIYALSEAGKENRIEKLSILVQFFLGEINAYCYAHKKTASNFGEILEGNPVLIDEIIKCIDDAIEGRVSIEVAILDFINSKKELLSLKEELSKVERQEIIARFNVDYKTCADSPHMDEFILYFPEVSGDFVNHHSRISFDFLHLAQKMNLLRKDVLSEESIEKMKETRDAFFGSIKSLGGRLPATNDKVNSVSVLEKIKSEIVSALVSAINSNDIEKVKNILSRLESLTVEARVDDFLLILSAFKGQFEIESRVINYLSEDFMWSSVKGNVKTVKRILIHLLKEKLFDVLNAKDEVGNNAMLLAIIKGHAVVVEEILKYVPKEKLVDLLNTKNVYGYTSLRSAVHNGDAKIAGMILRCVSKEERLELLNDKDIYGYTVLIYAVAARHVKVVEKVLEFIPEEKLVDVLNANNGYGYTALRLSVHDGNIEIVEKILNRLKYTSEENKIAVLNKKDTIGNSALMLAIRVGNVEAMEMILRCVSKGARWEILNSKDMYGCTVLMCAVIMGYVEVVEKILEYTPKEELFDMLSVQGIDGYTALSIANAKGFVEIAEKIESKIKYFFDEKIGVDTTSDILNRLNGEKTIDEDGVSVSHTKNECDDGRILEDAAKDNKAEKKMM